MDSFPWKIGVWLWLVIMAGILASNIDPKSTQAVDPPPVEVHIQEGHRLFMYDCYSANIEETPEESMVVYINFPGGLAGYQCNYASGVHIIPLLPKYPVIRVSLGRVEFVVWIVR